MSLIQSRIEGGQTELTERDLDQVTGGAVVGESSDDKHRGDHGEYGNSGEIPPRNPAKPPSVAGGSSWLGGKV